MNNFYNDRYDDGMITVKVVDTQLLAQKADGYVVFCEQDAQAQKSELLTAFYAPLLQVLEQRKFTGKAGSVCVVQGVAQGQPVTLILAGYGNAQRAQEDRIEGYRRAVGAVIRVCEQYKLSSLAVELPDHRFFDVDAVVLAQETVSIMEMASYHFDQFITDESARPSRDIAVTLCAYGAEIEQLTLGVEHGHRIGHAVNQARQWCDLPACVLTPTLLAEHAQRIAKVHDLKCRVFTEDEIIKMGMGGIEAVAKGSDQEARFVVIEYKTDHPDAPTVGLVGKGITFDSGGLSIKPAVSMETMKDDMAGAASVISTMEALAHLKPKVNVIAFAPITENLISGHATKPGDIIRFYNGKTAEVKNTDAEGRLILADALSYAVAHYKFDAVINIATLTGSCSAALGPFFAGLMSQHALLSAKLMASAQRSGDRLWPLPFHDDYKPAIRSDVADLCNIGNERYRAGAITAGFFLQNFVGSVPWAHLDVAGTAFNVPDMSYYRPGATGFGVRLFIDLVMNW